MDTQQQEPVAQEQEPSLAEQMRDWLRCLAENEKQKATKRVSRSKPKEER